MEVSVTTGPSRSYRARARELVTSTSSASAEQPALRAAQDGRRGHPVRIAGGDNGHMTATEASGARRRGPRAGGTDTRAVILAAAREEFAERGFTATTVRGIGARAGVDAAMINHYFGSKALLFREVTQIPVDPVAGLAAALAGPRASLGRRLALFILTTWEDAAFRDPVLAMLRSAAPGGSGAGGSGAGGLGLMRDYFASQLVPLVAAEARGADPMRQSVLAIAQVMGVIVGRHLIGLPDLRDPGVAELADELAPVVQRYLDGEHRT